MKTQRQLRDTSAPQQQTTVRRKQAAQNQPGPKLHHGPAVTAQPGVVPAKARANPQKHALLEAQHLMEVQGEFLRTAKREVEETLQRYASLHDDLVRVQADLASANERFEQRVIERTAQLTSANKELQHEFKERQRLEHELSERERSSLSLALHDGVCQHLAGVVMIATMLSEVCGEKSDTEMAGRLKEIASLIRSATNDARDVARALHPVDVDAHGLVAALHTLVNRYDAPGQTRCVLHCHEAIPVHDNDVAMHLYRIVLEAVVNASRYAHASHISVHLGVRKHDIVLTITDDGVGLPPDDDKSAGLGLKLMRYRASSIGAELTITARDTGGSVVRCSLPVPA